VSEAFKFCPECGTENAEGRPFCSNCGFGGTRDESVREENLEKTFIGPNLSGSEMLGYELTGWADDEQTAFSSALARLGIVHQFDEVGDLVVMASQEDAVDAAIEAFESGLFIDEGNAEPDKQIGSIGSAANQGVPSQQPHASASQPLSTPRTSQASVGVPQALTNGKRRIRPWVWVLTTLGAIAPAISMGDRVHVLDLIIGGGVIFLIAWLIDRAIK